MSFSLLTLVSYIIRAHKKFSLSSIRQIMDLSCMICLFYIKILLFFKTVLVFNYSFNTEVSKIKVCNLLCNLKEKHFKFDQLFLHS